MSGSSNTYAFNPPLSEFLLDAFERCGKRSNELTTEWMQSGRRSLNLVLSSWSNRGLNLWKQDQIVTYMPQGVAVYPSDKAVVDVLADSVTLRQYQMGQPVSEPCNFSTVANSPYVTVANLPATPTAGYYISIAVAVSVGGLILLGFYQVISVPGSGQAIINAGKNATATVASGGVVPGFATTGGSSVVTVIFPNHGLLLGQFFQVQVTTLVGGLTLLGPYTVISVLDANTFTISAPYPAGSSTGPYQAFPMGLPAGAVWSNTGPIAIVPGLTPQPGAAPLYYMSTSAEVLKSLGGGNLPLSYVGLGSGQLWNNGGEIAINNYASFPVSNGQGLGNDGGVLTVTNISPVYENNGLALLATAATVNGNVQPTTFTDILLYPLSRGDYMAIPEKQQQGRPTSFWFDRQITPQFWIWLVPDNNGPYELRYRMWRQVQDADFTMGQQLDVPYRLYEAFCADLAAHLAMKWAPERVKDLTAYAIAQWQLASDEDTERVPTFITPDLSGYFA